MIDNDRDRTIAVLSAQVKTLLADIELRKERRVVTVIELKAIVATISRVAGDMRRVTLNAAIESARMGDAGRGFGAVTEEIKRLAGLVHEAAADASHLIDDRARDRGIAGTGH